MKDFFRNFKIPIIFGGVALAAIIATLIVVTGGGGASYGLYISSASGSVSVLSSDNSDAKNSSGGDLLKNGDILTVGDNSSCTLAYKGRKNSDKNYMVIGSNSQVVVSNDFNGKENGELFLRSGSIIGNFAEEDASSVNIRTADSMISSFKNVSKISYSTNEFMSYTDLYTFMGENTIQLYDALGSPVNKTEKQIAKKWGRVVSEDGPEFKALNLDFELDELTVSDLKNLITIAAIAGDGFPYTAEELKAAYDRKSGEETETSSVTSETVADTSDVIQTAEPIETTTPPPTETTLPGHTTAAPVTSATTAATTAAPVSETQQTTETASDSSGAYHTVTIIVDGEETIQEVPHGGNAVKPEDPVIDGLTFIGWDGSFENITEDRIITAMFNEFISDTNPSGATTHKVTVVIGNRSNTIEVEHGKSANLPLSLNIEGYIFKGWDKDFSSIVSDITITAILEPVGKHTVTFAIGSDRFDVEVEHGGSVMPPYIPTADINGNRFVGWDKALNNILSDTTITAIFADDEYHTVTFIIDGQFYSVGVPHGETAEPPFWPGTNAAGNRFVGWDKSLENITSDVTITAYYE